MQTSQARLLSQSSFSHLKSLFPPLVLIKTKWVSAGPRKVSRNPLPFFASLCCTIWWLSQHQIGILLLQQYQHQPTGSPAQRGWLEDYCRNSSIRLSLSHTHPSLHTHAPGHITPAFIPFYLILSNSKHHSLFLFLQWLLYSVSSTLPHSSSIPDAWLYVLLGLPEIRLSGPESTSQSRNTFRGIVWWEIWIKHDSGAFTCSAVMYSVTMKWSTGDTWLQLHNTLFWY